MKAEHVLVSGNLLYFYQPPLILIPTQRTAACYWEVGIGPEPGPFQLDTVFPLRYCFGSPYNLPSFLLTSPFYVTYMALRVLLGAVVKESLMEVT